MVDTVLIFAAGDHTRYGDECKQLVDIAGEPLLIRTIRQLHARKVAPSVITHQQIIADTAKAAMVEPLFRYWLVESILSTIHYWQERVICLLGDVVWSSAALDTVLGDKRPVAVYGNTQELFALAWDSQTRPMRRTLDRVRLHAIEHPKPNAKNRVGGRGKLWNVYRALEGYKLQTHRIKQSGDIFVAIEDYTNDIDTPECYARFCEEIINKGVLDDTAKPNR